MYTEKMFVTRMQIIALSQIQQIEEHAHANPAGYKRDTEEYCGAIYDIVQNAPYDRLRDLVLEIRAGYEKLGFADDGVMADSLLTLVLMDYQAELGGDAADAGCSGLLENFFRVETDRSEEALLEN